MIKDAEMKKLTHIHVELQGPRIAKTILKKKNEIEGLTFIDFKTYQRATTVIKTMRYVHMDKRIDQQHRTESYEIALK